MLSQVTFIPMQGYKQKKAYIIAEGPMESTTKNMWKLIYDRKCGVMVMLSDLLEDGMVSYEIIIMKQNNSKAWMCTCCYLE